MSSVVEGLFPPRRLRVFGSLMGRVKRSATLKVEFQGRSRPHLHTPLYRAAGSHECRAVPEVEFIEVVDVIGIEWSRRSGIRKETKLNRCAFFGAATRCWAFCRAAQMTQRKSQATGQPHRQPDQRAFAVQL